uniref:Uncharacterized protein n=1 Tax=viral metagenome TaxID=1070528 RepID=A0A6M3L9J0_9ZZZZ
MKKQEIKREFKEALATYLEPINLGANMTRVRLGLPPVDVTERPEIAHQINYFELGFKDGVAGYYDKWYEDKKAYNAYLQGNYKGREFYSHEFQTIGI